MQSAEIASGKVRSISRTRYVTIARDDPPPFKLQGYKAGTTLEGMLFPATYEVAPGTSAGTFIDRQLAAFDDQFAEVDMTRATKANLTAYDIVIIASMVDREAMVAAERPLVAAVIWNRLKQGMLLQIDATIQYALGKTKAVLTYDDLKIDSPYNTYLHAGLPPTPIIEPGPGGDASRRRSVCRRLPVLRRAQRRHRATLLLVLLRAVPGGQGEGGGDRPVASAGPPVASRVAVAAGACRLTAN